LSSGEGLIHRVRDPIIFYDEDKQEEEVIDAGVKDQRLFIYESEFASALAVMKREGNTLSMVVRPAWDGQALQIATKNSPAKSSNHTISILGDITQEELSMTLGAADRYNGFANRFLWLHVERMKELPFGGEEIDWKQEIEGLKDAVEFAKKQRRVYLDENARKMWARAYSKLSKAAPGIFGAVTSRSEAQVIRLALLYALLDESTHIRSEHLKAALALWQYAEDSARHIFGGLTPEQQKILDFLAEGPRNKSDITHRLFKRNRPAVLIHTDIEGLKRARKIKVEEKGGVEWFRLMS
jgi:hypothetical protein